MKKINFKSKLLWAGILVVVVVIIILIPKGSQAPKYETAKVERGLIVQTVDATGKLESSNGVSLRFQMSGNIGKINVKEGDKIVKDQLLANLDLPELDAAVSQAQASLNQKYAGATDEQISINQKQLESAKLALEKAESNLIDVTKLAEENLKSVNSSLGKAEKNLADVTKLTEENLKASYNSAASSLDDANIKIYNSYTLVDSVKNTYFNGSDQQGLKVKSILSNQLTQARDDSKNMITKIKGDDYTMIDSSIDKMINYLNSVLISLTEVRDMCDENNYKSTIPDATRVSIDSQKAVISTSKNSIIALRNEIAVLKTQNENSINTAQNAITSIENEISVLKIQNENSINSAKSAIDTAKSNVEIQEANLNSVMAPPREVDLAYNRAVLEQARANKLKSLLYSPADGVISKVNKKEGELVGPGDIVFEIISPHEEVVVDVSETDVVKLAIGDEAAITFDALGSDVKFKGRVLTIEPSSTEIQGVVYYKVKIDIEDENETIKPGMTANVLIETEKKENVVSLASRALISKDSKKYVRILEQGAVVEREVTVGFRGDGGVVEILAGLEGGEEVILKTLDK